jgi:hypothetical protein
VDGIDNIIKPLAYLFKLIYQQKKKKNVQHSSEGILEQRVNRCQEGKAKVQKKQSEWRLT